MVSTLFSHQAAGDLSVKLYTKLAGNIYRDNLDFFAKTHLYESNLQLLDGCYRTIGLLNCQDNFTSGEATFLQQYLGSISDPTILDIGAHNGSYSALAKKIQPSAKIYAFEPSPKTFARLRSNAKEHNFFSFEIGFSNKEGTARLYDRTDCDGSEHASLYRDVISDIHCQDSYSEEISITTVDSFAEKAGLSFIDLLKIDTEGHEYQVLQGAANMLAQNKIKAIHFEFNEMNVFSRVFMKDFYELLPDYSFYRMLPDGLIPLGPYKPATHELFAFQNIAALNNSLFQ
ncbi:FkbM family methyltransferase [Desulfovibrio sp. JC010]|nr:FkbM family methyltransferase [Desulfovibrio sp. JC010]